MKSGGKVQYSVQLTTGASDIPSNSILTLTTLSSSGSHTPDITTFSNAVCNSSGLTDMVPGQAVPNGSNIATTTWDCVFSITVTPAHELVGRIAPFDVRFGYTDGAGGQLSPAYFIPKATTPNVLVYTSAYLTYGTYEVVSGPNVIDGEMSCVPSTHWLIVISAKVWLIPCALILWITNPAAYHHKLPGSVSRCLV